jgi:hypothetical protein
MTISGSARQALEAAVRLNPDGARELYAILRTAPDAVKRKPDDRFGPLAMMVLEAGPRESARSTLGIVRRPALPAKLHPQARRFQRDWLEERISKAALAEAIEACLHRDGQPVPEVSGRWHRIRPKASGR